jgi:flagellar hook protein FlgE
MVRSLTSGVSGIQQFQTKMDVIGNNIANVNTTGFKSGRVDFADAFSQTLRSSAAASGSASATPAIQVGSGVTTAAIKNIYTQGSIARTGYETDLAISGDGYFIVRDPISQVEYATRAGDFRLDGNGYLTNNSGLHVQGYDDIALSNVGDVVIDTLQRPTTADPNATMTDFSIDPQGHIVVKLSDGSEYTRGQILLQKFSDEQALTKAGLNLYSSIGAAGPLGGSATPTPAAPGTNGLGSLESGALELSNVDLANEFANLITTQRSFQANARIITTSDEMLQELVNLKR